MPVRNLKKKKRIKDNNKNNVRNIIVPLQNLDPIWPSRQAVIYFARNCRGSNAKDGSIVPSTVAKTTIE